MAEPTSKKPDAISETLLARIKEAITNLVTLEIVTAVGEVKEVNGKSLEIDLSKNPSIILTKIDLLQGDIKTVYHENFVTGEYKELKEFHKLREEQGHEIIKNNIETLKKIYDFAKKL